MSSPVIIVVGAGPGIGAAAARRFAAVGYDVGLIAREGSRLETFAGGLTEGGTAVGFATVDVGEPGGLSHALEAMGEHNGRLDVLLYNAVTAKDRRVSEMSAADLLAELHVDAAGLLTSLQAVLPMLLTQHTGTVLATTRPGDRGAPALEALVQALAPELKTEGIHVATVKVSPGTDPELVAAAYTDLADETAADPATWRTSVSL